jgi:hypothetical protein
VYYYLSLNYLYLNYINMYYNINKSLLSALLLFSAVIGFCSGDTIYPKALSTQRGSASSTSLSALRSKDQTGSQDTWSKYVEFYGSSNAYVGVFTFDVSSLSPSSVTAYTLDVNYKGPAENNQVWQFEYYVPAEDSWILAGDNTNAPSWSWTALSFCGQTSFASLVKDGNLKLRFSSTTTKDDCDLDFLAITTSEDASATSAPTSEPTSAPTTRPTSAPTTRPSSAPTTRPTEAATQAPTEAATQAPTQKATAAPTQKATAAPTQKATAAPTQKATAAPTQKATAAPTQKATAAPTQKATAAPTQKATAAPTQKATAAPTQKATAAPTQKATAAPTQKATAAPTQKATAAPTNKPTNPPTTPGGRICPTGQVWVPAPGTTWQWQLTGTIDQSKDVQMYDIDLFDATAAVISSLHSKGRVVICYFSSQYEDWRSDASKFSSDILGANLDDWPGERYVDIRSAKLRKIMTERLDLAVSKGCDGVEPDNVDSYANSNGLGLKAADQLDYNRFIANESHKRGLSVGLKNDLDQVAALVSSFDWALNEQCNEYGECGTLSPFVAAGKAVFGVEYTGSSSKVCPSMVTAKFSWLMKDLDLGAAGTACCPSSGCVKASYTCVNYSSKRSEIEDGTESIELAEESIVSEIQTEDFDSAASSITIVSAAFVFLAAVLVL